MNLHHEFIRLAFDINKMKNKLISLLLEIYEKEIYKKHGCVTIYEYGFKYARLSREVVQKALRTLKNVADKPCLKKAIETQGIHKVALVATIATAETDKAFAQHVENMSKPALFELAREMRNERTEENRLFGASCDHLPQKCQASPEKMKIELDEETQILFLKLKKQFAKDSSHKHALKIILQITDRQVLNKKHGKDVPGNASTNASRNASTNASGNASRNASGNASTNASGNAPTNASMTASQVKSPQSFPTRYIPKQQKQKILAKHEHRCAYPGCAKPHDVIHHRTPFAISKSHESAVPLCHNHHEFAHNGLIGHQHQEAKNWKLNIHGQKTLIDAFYLKQKIG